ncbi:MAG: RNA polymerase sigma factor, partial [Omnitrophica WOR_2 bacterium]
YQTRAVHAAYLIVQDGPMAEDVVQDSFLQAYQEIGQFDDSRPFGPWFLRSVVNASVKAINRQNRSISLNVDDDDDDLQIFEKLADPQPSPEEMAQQAETRQVVQKALERLVPEQRAVVVLRYYLELSEAEMTHELIRPLSTVKWLLHSAKKRLRHLLGPLKARMEEPAADCQESNEQEE